MNRRVLLKHLAVASTAALILPSCVSDPKKVSVALSNLKITGEEEELLGEIGETIIPATDTPGAKMLGAHLFALVMVDDCLPKEDQEKYLSGMRSFTETLKSLTGKSFMKASSGERLEMLTKLEQDRDTLSEDVKTFYGRTRGYIIQGYLSSQHFLTNVKPYQLIPGPNYKGCVPVAAGQKTIS